MHRYMVVGLGLVLGLAAAWGGDDVATSPVTQAGAIAEEETKLDNLSLQQLADMISREAQDPMMRRMAAAAFARKALYKDDGPKLTQELIDRIIPMFNRPKREGRSLHDWSDLIDCLGELQARKEILDLLDYEKQWACHGGPNLAVALARCGDPRDVQTLISMIDRESEGCGGVVNDALAKLTGTSLPLENWRTSKARWEQAWKQKRSELLGKTVWATAAKLPHARDEEHVIELRLAIQKATSLTLTLGPAPTGSEKSFHKRACQAAGELTRQLASHRIGCPDALHVIIDDTWDQLAVMVLKEGVLWYEYALVEVGPAGEETYGSDWQFLPVGKDKWVQMAVTQSMSQLRHAAVSTDRKYLALVVVGEGHPVLDVFDLPALLEKQSAKPLYSVDPYPGGIGLVYWKGDGLHVESEMPLSHPTRDKNGRVPAEMQMDAIREYVMDAATGKFINAPTPVTKPATRPSD